MALKIRLARGGTKKRPVYRIVVAESGDPRDGRFIEKLGSYNPMLPRDHEERVRFNTERMQHWLSVGAQPTDRVARFLDAAGLRTRAERNNPNKAKPKAKAQERLEAARQAAEEASGETPNDATDAPAEEAETAAEA